MPIRQEKMFSNLAPRYDRINHVISAGLDESWRRSLVGKLPQDQKYRHILDACCGTGALLHLLAQAYPESFAVGLDFAPGMLLEARRRLRESGQDPQLVQGDLNHLPFEDGYFTLVANAFGLRNSVDPRRALLEMDRVLAPGGTLAILELTRPPANLFGKLFGLYFDHMVPCLAACLGGERGAFVYLSTSVRNFLAREELGASIAALIGGRTSVYPLFDSVVTLVMACKPLV